MTCTVGSKIGTGFAVVSAVFLLVAWVAYQSATKLHQTAEWVAHSHKVLSDLDVIHLACLDAETGERGYLITGDTAYLDPYQRALTSIDHTLGDLKELTKDNPVQQQRAINLQKLTSDRVATLQKVITLYSSEGPDASRQSVLSGQGKREMELLRNQFDELKQEEDRLLISRSVEADASIRSMKLVVIMGTLVGFVLSCLIGIVIARSIANPMKELTRVAEKIAMGDLSAELRATGRRDEVGLVTRAFVAMTQSLRGMADVATSIASGDLQVAIKPHSDKDLLGKAFASMVDNLQRAMVQLKEGVQTLSVSTNQISTTSAQLASSAAQTSAAVTETTTTVEEVRQTAQVSTQKAKHVSESTQRVAHTTQAGRQSTEATISEIRRVREQMDSIAEGMVRLSEQNKTVGQIIATVDDLAAQSNILAINASIEAAKAGEQGRGFSVVAQEVRSLAEQSKQATGQVRTILNDIQKATSSAVMVTEQGAKAVESGVTRAGEAGESIQSLASGVSEAAQAATQIAASSQQQLVGMDQVASAMESIKQASVQNVTSAKQLESAAHSLKDLGNRIKQIVEEYRL